MNAPGAKAVAAKPVAAARAGRALLQRMCACGNGSSGGDECESCRRKRGELQRLAASQSAEKNAPAVAPPIVHDVLRSAGRPLDAATRAFMESRFDHNFSGVRIHTDARAAESTRAVSALAYTVGQHIVFGPSQFDHSSVSRQQLLAHELTHTVQQRHSSADSESLHISEPDDALEREAETISMAIARGLRAEPAFAGALDTGDGKRLLAHELAHVLQQQEAMESSLRPHPTVLQRQPAPSVTRPPFDDQPSELRSVLEASFAAGKFGCRHRVDAASCFNRLDPGARLVLTSLYTRLSRLGLWAHVLYVGGIWTSGVGGAHFTVTDHRSVFADLLSNARFCVDTPAGGLLHRGSTSLREISTGDSLHLSIGEANVVSAHIDAISPVAGREAAGQCRYDSTRAVAHIGREAFPGLVKIPGLQIFPEPRPTVGLPERGAPPPEIVRIEIFRF